MRGYAQGLPRTPADKALWSRGLRDLFQHEISRLQLVSNALLPDGVAATMARSGPFTCEEAALNWLGDELPLLMDTLRHGVASDDASDLGLTAFCELLQRLLVLTDHWEHLRLCGESLIEFSELHGDEAAASLGNRVLGSVFLHHGELRAARRHATRSRDLAHRLGDKVGEANALSLLGQVHGAEGSPDRAVRCLVEAVELFHSVDHLAGESLTCSYLGEQYLDAGRPREALRYLRRGKRLADKLRSADLVFVAIRLLSALHCTVGATELAVLHGKRALELSAGRPSRHNRAKALLQLGLVLRGERRAEAVGYLMDAYALFREVGDHRRADLALAEHDACLGC